MWPIRRGSSSQRRLLDALVEGREAFVNSQELWAQRSVWLSTSGPLGAEATHAEGADRHADFEPMEIRGFREAIRPRDHRVFVGALDPGRLSFAEWSCLKIPATRAILSEGDFGDWAQIKGWARGIALLNAARPPHRTAEAVPSLPPHFESPTLPTPAARPDCRSTPGPARAHHDTPTPRGNLMSARGGTWFTSAPCDLPASSKRGRLFRTGHRRSRSPRRRA
jgi:hypothetical protein